MNSGTITAGHGAAVESYYGGRVANNLGGLIQGDTGIALFTGNPGPGAGRGGMVTNAGTIAGTAGVGILLKASGTVIDSGTISGSNGTAIQFGGDYVGFGATSGNHLVLEAGYKLIGGVAGSTHATNTVELAGSVGAPLTANYNGLMLTNFQDVLFGPGGYDTLKVGNTGGTLPVTISGFAATSDVIDLTAIGTDGSITGQSGTLVTVSGSLGTVTLQLDASDVAKFTVVSDGTAGTDIIPVAAAGSVSINDVSLAEGNSGPEVMIFTVTRSGGTAAFDISYATADGTATTADSDYVAAAGTLHFAASETSKTIAVTINDDGTVVPDEMFNVNLSAPTNGATIGRGTGVGTIVNDDLGGPQFALGNFAIGAGGWTSENTYPRQLGDVNGDGLADIVGFGSNGVYVALATGGGKFASPIFGTGGFGTDSGGWTSQDTYPRELADVDRDGTADIVGFGSNGVYVALRRVDGTFGNTFLATSGFGTDSGGWTSQNIYPRELADVDGDGTADIVGFGSNGVYVTLCRKDTFGNTFLATPGFGTDSGGWTSQDAYPREVADVNGDGRADIVAFASDGVYVALGKGDGTFGDPFLATTAFGTNNGWTSQDTYPRELADINGDGRADIVAFGADGIYTALANSDGTFQPPVFDFNDLGASPAAGGFDSNNTYPRLLGDVTGDHKADIVAFAADGTYVADATTIFLPSQHSA